jgi:hypothetical protein
MNSSYPSFLSENKNRTFPFVENHSINLIKNNYFLDFRGWTKFKVNERPNFYFAVKKNDNEISLPSSIPQEFYDFFIKDNFLHLFFCVHKIPTNLDKFNGLICLYIPLDNEVWPYTAKTSLYNSGGTKMFEFKSLITEGIFEIFDTETDFIFINDNTGLDIEPSQIFHAGGVVVDEIEILDDLDNQKRLVAGDIKLMPGFNSSMIQLNNTISINALSGLGIGKKYNDTATDICEGIFSINGVNPNDSGLFKIEGSNGILIFNSPESSQIVISIDPKTSVAKCQT